MGVCRGGEMGKWGDDGEAVVVERGKGREFGKRVTDLGIMR